MRHAYTLSFTANRQLTPEEVQLLSKKLSAITTKQPFGPWKPEQPDPALLTSCVLHKEIDPLLGYDRKWLVTAILDHLIVQRQRIKESGVNSDILQDLEFSLVRIDEFAGEKVPTLEDVRDIVAKGVY